jgi:hypothetical protein
MNTLPSDDLELRAAAQRRQLQVSLNELRGRIREKLDVKKGIRHHVLLASGFAAAISVVLGYGAAGMFLRR